MVSDDLAKQLHDRATRGELLSAEEQSLLEDWYALLDCMESDTLGLTTDEKTLASLQAQVESALIQLMTVTKRIQEVAAENETLRHEVAVLRRQLVHQPTSQPA